MEYSSIRNLLLAIKYGYELCSEKYVTYVYKSWFCWYNFQKQVKLTCSTEKQDNVYV